MFRATALLAFAVASPLIGQNEAQPDSAATETSRAYGVVGGMLADSMIGWLMTSNCVRSQHRFPPAKQTLRPREPCKPRPWEPTSGSHRFTIGE